MFYLIIKTDNPKMCAFDKVKVIDNDDPSKSLMLDKLTRPCLSKCLIEPYERC